MRMKKFVALATTVVMALASTGTAFATASTNPTGESKGTVDGASTYVDTVKYKVTLPTSSNLSFNIDPEGLYGYFVDNGSKTSVDGADLSNYAGSVAPSSSATVTNMSSIPVVVTCKFNVTTAAKVTVKKLTDTLDDSKTELALGIVPLKTAQVVTSSAIALATPNALSVTSTDTKTPNQMLFALAAADYEFTKDNSGKYDYVQKSKGDKVIDATYAHFQIGGKVSKTANWSELTGDNAKKVSLDCVFSYVGASSITGAADVDYAVVTDESKITYLQKNSDTPTDPSNPSNPTTGVATLCTITSGVSAKITSSLATNKPIYISVDSKLLTDTADKLTSVKINNVAITPAATSNSAANGNALYFKLPTNITLKVNDVITVKVGDTSYTFTVTE